MSGFSPCPGLRVTLRPRGWKPCGFRASIQVYRNVHDHVPMGWVVSATEGNRAKLLGQRAERSDRQKQQGADHHGGSE